MRFKNLTITVGCVILLSCAKSKKDPCFDEKKGEFKKTCCTHGAKIKEYEFQGESVYVFDPGICGADQTSEVTTKKCETLGYLGGISANTKINGEDFSNAKFRRTIWAN